VLLTVFSNCDDTAPTASQAENSDGQSDHQARPAVAQLATDRCTHIYICISVFSGTESPVATAVSVGGDFDLVGTALDEVRSDAIGAFEIAHPDRRADCVSFSPAPCIPSTYSANVGAGEVMGTEIELVLKPAEGLTLTGLLAYSETELVDSGGQFVFDEGRPLPASPELNASLAMSYDFPVGERWTATLGGEVHYIDSYLFYLQTDFWDFCSFACPRTSAPLRATCRSHRWAVTPRSACTRVSGQSACASTCSSTISSTSMM